LVLVAALARLSASRFADGPICDELRSISARYEYGGADL
jgi:hypothetical protein